MGILLRSGHGDYKISQQHLQKMNFRQTVAPSPSVATLSLRTDRVPRPPMAVGSAMT